MDSATKRVKLKQVVFSGKQRGFPSYAEINHYLPDDTHSVNELERLVGCAGGSSGLRSATDPQIRDAALFKEKPVHNDLADETEVVLAAVDSEVGCATDPLQTYLRQMRNLGLLLTD